MWNFNVHPDPSFWITEFALHISTMGWRNFVSHLEFSFTPFGLFFFSKDFCTKSKVNASEGVLVGFLGSKGPLIIKEPHTEIDRVH